MDHARDPDDRQILAEGRLQTGMAGDGSFRWAATDLSDMVDTMSRRLDLYPVAAAALGRALSASALLLRMVSKTPTRLILEIRGDGPLRMVRADADDRGHLRGTVGNPHAQVPDLAGDKLPVGRAVGDGFLRVFRQYEKGRYDSQVELVSGEIGIDVAHYLRQSEQSRPAVLVGVLGRHEGVAAAGGLILEALPGTSDSAFRTVEGNLASLPGVSRLLEEGGLEEALSQVFFGLDPQVRDETPLYYSCTCDRERFLKLLSSFSEEDLAESRLPDGSIEATCHFCADTFRYEVEELELG